MSASRRDPYLWIHLAGLAVVPLCLDLCLVGFAVGDPALPAWLEVGSLGLVGSLPILWMQWQRPFYIFSILALAIRPDRLSEHRRRLLVLQRGWLSRVLVGSTALGLILMLSFLYQLAPIAATVMPFAGQPRLVGWLICAVSFLLANLFTQVPASVVPLLLAAPSMLQKVQPYDSASILNGFTLVGFRVPRILPDLAETAEAEQSAPQSESLEVSLDEETSSFELTVLESEIPEPSEIDISATAISGDELKSEHEVSALAAGIAGQGPFSSAVADTDEAENEQSEVDKAIQQPARSSEARLGITATVIDTDDVPTPDEESGTAEAEAVDVMLSSANDGASVGDHVDKQPIHPEVEDTLAAAVTDSSTVDKAVHPPELSAALRMETELTVRYGVFGS
ncbi:MAG: low-complexity tail membrane protein [Leptolyngbya sp. SIO1D8]|nr:low-complexity tail membrane protein [Leptolyngbya sp. SIO1D8]